MTKFGAANHSTGQPAPQREPGSQTSTSSRESASSSRTNLLDRIATAWLVRRGKLVDLKPWPMRITCPPCMTEGEAEAFRASWERLFTARDAQLGNLYGDRSE